MRYNAQEFLFDNTVTANNFQQITSELSHLLHQSINSMLHSDLLGLLWLTRHLIKWLATNHDARVATMTPPMCRNGAVIYSSSNVSTSNNLVTTTDWLWLPFTVTTLKPGQQEGHPLQLVITSLQQLLNVPLQKIGWEIWPHLQLFWKSDRLNKQEAVAVGQDQWNICDILVNNDHQIYQR